MNVAKSKHCEMALAVHAALYATEQLGILGLR